MAFVLDNWDAWTRGVGPASNPEMRDHFWDV
jgi:hypothetical protein